MYTPGQVAQLLDAAPSTVRRYAVLFSPFLSSGANKRRRIYSQSDLATLTRVRELISDGTLSKDIPPQLEKVIDENPNGKALALPGLIAQIQDMQAVFETQAAQLTQLEKRCAWLETPFYKKFGRTPPE
jgi:DNA-binding transcriptional MerR regulator